MMRLGRGKVWVLAACLICVLWAGIGFGRTRPATDPSANLVGPSSAWEVDRSTEGLDESTLVPELDSKAGSVAGMVLDELGSLRTGETDLYPVSQSTSPTRIGIAVATVSDQLVALWEQISLQHAALDEPSVEKEPGVLAEALLFGDVARVRTTYEMVDLDQLKQHVRERSDEPSKLVGISGEISIGDVGSLRIGYGLRQGVGEGNDRYVGVADAEIAYRVGERTTLAADVEWGVGATVEKAAGVNVSYMIAPNTSLKAGYHLLNFDDVDGSKEYHNAAAGIQLRF